MFKINGEWVCPACGEVLTGEEIDEVRARVPTLGRMEFRCEACDEPLTADTGGVDGGQIAINEEWVYD